MLRSSPLVPSDGNETDCFLPPVIPCYELVIMLCKYLLENILLQDLISALEVKRWFKYIKYALVGLYCGNAFLIQLCGIHVCSLLEVLILKHCALLKR